MEVSRKLPGLAEIRNQRHGRHAGTGRQREHGSEF